MPGSTAVNNTRLCYGLKRCIYEEALCMGLALLLLDRRKRWEDGANLKLPSINIGRVTDVAHLRYETGKATLLEVLALFCSLLASDK
jgi:hypothetical protein